MEKDLTLKGECEADNNAVYKMYKQAFEPGCD